MRAPNRSGSFVPSPQGNARRRHAEIPGAGGPSEGDPDRGAARSHLYRVGLAAIALTLVAGCDTQRATVATAPAVHADATALAVTADADADTSVDVSELGATSFTPEARPTTLGGPLAGLDAGLLARFEQGRDDFIEVESVEDGIGPVFNELSCGTCHDTPVGGTTGRGETRFGRIVNGRFDPLAERGGSLLQDHAIGVVAAGVGAFTYVPEAVPAEANVRATRITTPLFGLGLVDAVTDATLLLLARLEAFRSPETRGVANLVTEIGTGAMRVGRFGWKAQVATLHQFSGDAYLNEMGVTSPQFPDENCPQGDCASLAFNPVPALNNDGEDVEHFADFMTLLGPPPRGERSFRSQAGAAVFRRIGCASCHTPSLVTGASPVGALSHKVFQPYSDFLLHDMGELGDGIVQGNAGARQMRTAPLWGLDARRTYLHDGRATSVEAAILGHAGQGAMARSRYARLNPNLRAALLAFLRSL